MPVKYRLCAKQTHANLPHTQGHERQPTPPQPAGALGCGRLWNSRRISEARQGSSEAEAGPCFLGSFLFSWCWRPARGHPGLGCAQKQQGYLLQSQFPLHTREPLWVVISGAWETLWWFWFWVCFLHLKKGPLLWAVRAGPCLLPLLAYSRC